MDRIALTSLIDWKKKKTRMPLILNGARQTGKTYLLKQFAATEFKHSLYVNFEEDPKAQLLFAGDLKPERLINELQLHFDTSFDLKNDLLILDEIQAAPRALTALKYFKEKFQDSFVCAAGSLLGIHLSYVSFPVGCVEIMNLYPLSFREFLNAQKNKALGEYFLNCDLGELSEVSHEKFWENLKKYLILGGLPGVLNSFFESIDDGKSEYEAFKSARAKQKMLIDNYLSDIAKHSGKISAMDIERTFRAVAIQLGQAHDGNAAAFRFKDVLQGHKSSKVGYRELAGPIDWLSKASLIHQHLICEQAAIPLGAYTKQNRFKLFIFDIGILGTMIDLPPKAIWDYNFGTYKSYFIENFVACELAALKTNQVSSQTIYSWSEGTAELEFLLTDDESLIIPIEVKSGQSTRSKSLTTFIAKYSPKKAIKLIGKLPEPGKVQSNRCIQILPIYFASRYLDAIKK